MTSHKEIEVLFIEKQTGMPLTDANIPLDELPEDFPPGLVLQLGEEEWLVESADPVYKEDFAKSGKITLYLSKAEDFDPEQLLYSVPTINQDLAELDEDSELSSKEYVIHEDDWRNIEIVPHAHEAEVSLHLQEILRIHSEHGSEFGFEEIYVRKGYHTPLSDQDLSLDILDVFEVEFEYEGCTYDGANKRIKDSFAFLSKGGILFYGRAKEGNITELCIDNCFPTDEFQQDVEKFRKLLETHKCELADWAMAILLPPESENFHEYFAYYEQGEDQEITIE